MPMSTESKVTIKIPRVLYRKIKEIIEGSGFDSVTDFVVFVLRDIASTPTSRLRSHPDGEAPQLTAQEVEQVRQRLRNLGYL